MNETIKIVLSLSLSGSLLILILYLLWPLFKERLSRRWQYYIWLVVVVRLLLPFAPETNMMGTLFQGIDKGMEQMEFVPSPDQGAPSIPEGDTQQSGDMENVQGDLDHGQLAPMVSAVNPAQNILAVVLQNLWLGWLVIALILFIRKITIYQDFVKYIRAGCKEVGDIDLLERFGKLVEQNKVRTAIELYTNNLISSPLLIGFFRPCIVLPSADLTPVDFEYTILHELMHYKWWGMFYKWLVQFSVCVHWFNPLVYLMGQEVNRACELSCDEAVIKSLDEGARRAYGDTLLNAMGVGGNYKDSLASVTLNEGKELLRERLDAIMKFKKTTRLTAAISMMLIFVICFGATAAGAYTNPKQQPKDDIKEMENQNNNSNLNTTTVPVDIETVKNGTFIWLGEFTLSYGDKIYYDVSAEKGNALKTGFAAPDDDPLNRTYFTMSNKRENGTLETKGGYTFETEAPVEPGQYNLFIQATDGDLTNVKGSIRIKNTQSPTGTTPILSATENVKVNFSGITILEQF